MPLLYVYRAYNAPYQPLQTSQTDYFLQQFAPSFCITPQLFLLLSLVELFPFP